MTKLLKFFLRAGLISFIALVGIEIVLQIAFLKLPQTLISRMPQYPERYYGIQFNTEHGARRYPPNERVDFEVTSASGDLYQNTCLSPAHAESIEPYRVAYTRDQQGFRNNEPWPDDVELVIVGDSFTAAESVRRPYWDGIAESMLVFGLPGSGALEQKLLLEAFGLPRHPEIAVLAYFGGNDLIDNENFAELQQAGLTFADKTHQNRNPLEYLVSFHLALFLRDSISAARDKTCHYPQTALTDPPASVAFFDKLIPALAIEESALRASDMYQLTEAAIIEMAAMVQSSDAAFVLMYIPQKAELYWEYLNQKTKQSILDALPMPISADQVDANLTVQRETVASLAAEHGFIFLDLKPALAEAIAQGKSPYFFADTHWNQVGHDIARRVLLKCVRQLTLDKNPDLENNPEAANALMTPGECP